MIRTKQRIELLKEIYETAIDIHERGLNPKRPWMTKGFVDRCMLWFIDMLDGVEIEDGDFPEVPEDVIWN